MFGSDVRDLTDAEPDDEMGSPRDDLHHGHVTGAPVHPHAHATRQIDVRVHQWVEYWLTILSRAIDDVGGAHREGLLPAPNGGTETRLSRLLTQVADHGK